MKTATITIGKRRTLPPRARAGVSRFIVTGSSGTLGSRVLEQLMQRPGAKVLALLRDKSQVRMHREGIDYKRIDFLDQAACTRAVRDFEPECLIHCAASGVQIPRPQWFDLIRFNVGSTIDLCESVAAQGGCRFVFISTGLAYRPTGRRLKEEDAMDTQHPYGASKAAADLLIRAAATEFGVPLTVLRPFSFTGLNDDGRRLFPALLRAAEQGEPAVLSAGTQVRDHCAVDDVAAGVVKAAIRSSAEPLSVFNLGSGREATLRRVVEEVVEELGLKVDIQWGGRPLNPYEPKHLVADVTRVRKELGWEARKSLAYAVWELARASFPTVKVKKPKKYV